MQRRVKRTWRGERVQYLQRVDGRWKLLHEPEGAEQLWEYPGAIPVFTEFDLPNGDRSPMHSDGESLIE